ncbi:hypothetical protein BKA62DRAFT_692873 [Auriculariales sp. MPI-PUGE-AT-0066]|nr:hypothetical protein BKA62DRAFT_692873 [Auriculariales sp. MPI-PUGE-AT-0066]
MSQPPPKQQPTPAESNGSYEPKPVWINTGFAGAQLGGAGLLVSAVTNALDAHNRGAWGIFTRSGGTIAFFASVGAAFGFTDAFVANMREKNDAWNGAAGGCAVGAVAGLRARSLPAACISCVAVGAMVAAFDSQGGRLAGDGRTRDDPIEREARRQAFFKTKSSFPMPESPAVSQSS